jgi:hypothetical protein
MAVADAGDAEGRGQVDEAVAVDVEHVGAAGFLPEERGRAAIASVDDRRLAGSETPRQGARAPAGDRCPEARQQISAAKTGGHARKAIRLRA